MFKSNKTLRTLLCANFVMALLLSALMFTGCDQPKDETKDPDTKALYSVNGEEVSEEKWKELVDSKFTSQSGKKYGKTTEGEWANTENLWLTVKEDGTLYYNYESGYGSYNGYIYSFNNEIDDGKEGFVLLLKTDDNHTNYTQGSCSGAPESLDDTKAHTCYIPVYFAFTDAGLVNGAYYSGSTACFYTKEAALENMKYDSAIYGYAATYPAR